MRRSRGIYPVSNSCQCGAQRHQRVAGLESAKTEFRHRRRQIVAAGFEKREKRSGHDGADRVAPDVLLPGVAIKCGRSRIRSNGVDQVGGQIENRECGQFASYLAPAPRPDDSYFVNLGRGGVGVGAAGEITNVTQVFQPSGRFSAANSL